MQPCIYWCPAQDNLGFQLGPPGTKETETDFQCSYPAVEGENPDDFYCLYSKVGISPVFGLQCNLKFFADGRSSHRRS
jgi:hypothetical protein